MSGGCWQCEGKGEPGGCSVCGDESDEQAAADRARDEYLENEYPDGRTSMFYYRDLQDVWDAALEWVRKGGRNE